MSLHVTLFSLGCVVQSVAVNLPALCVCVCTSNIIKAKYDIKFY